jgi:hypothetical protein
MKKFSAATLADGTRRELYGCPSCGSKLLLNEPPGAVRNQLLGAVVAVGVPAANAIFSGRYYWIVVGLTISMLLVVDYRFRQRTATWNRWLLEH